MNWSRESLEEVAPPNLASSLKTVPAFPSFIFLPCFPRHEVFFHGLFLSVKILYN